MIYTNLEIQSTSPHKSLAYLLESLALWLGIPFLNTVPLLTPVHKVLGTQSKFMPPTSRVGDVDVIYFQPDRESPDSCGSIVIRRIILTFALRNCHSVGCV